MHTLVISTASLCACVCKEAGRTPKGADPGGSVLPGRPASLLWESEQDLFS